MFTKKSVIIDGIVYNTVDINSIKPLKGFARGFMLGIDYSHNSSVVGVYTLTTESLRDTTPSGLVDGWTLGELRGALAFGREGSDGRFVGVKWLANHFSEIFDLAYLASKTELESYKTTQDFGRALENWLCAKKGYTHGTAKMDINQKIDVYCRGQRWQVKCSIIPSESSKKSYSKTNGSVFH